MHYRASDHITVVVMSLFYTLKIILLASSTKAADNILFFFSKKIRFEISDGSSAMQTIHMKCQALKKRKRMSFDTILKGAVLD